MEKSPRELLWHLFSLKREATEKLNTLMKNKENIEEQLYEAKLERLERTIHSLNAHLEDMNIIIHTKKSE